MKTQDVDKPQQNPSERAMWAVAIILALFCVLTYQRNKVWQSEITLWSDVVMKSPQKSRPRIQLAAAYKKQASAARQAGRISESRTLLITALKHLNVVPALKDAGDLQPGVFPTTPRNIAGVNASSILYELGDEQQAIDILEDVRKVEPTNMTVLLNLATMRRVRGEFNEARILVSQAADLYPNNPAVLITRGDLLIAVGRCDLAIKDYDAARLQDPDAPDIRASARAYDETRRTHPELPPNPCGSEL